MANLRHGAPVAHKLFFGAHVHLVGTPNAATPEQMTSLALQKSFLHRKGRPAKPSPPVRLQTYAIDYTVSTQQLVPGARAPRHEPFLLQVAVAVFDADGQTLISKLQRTRAAVPLDPSTISEASSSDTGETVQPGFLRFQQKIDAPPNAASLRLAVRDPATDRVGALEVSLPLAIEPETQAGMDVQPAESAVTVSHTTTRVMACR
jgi:hypothetical protein